MYSEYSENRRWHQDISGSLKVSASTDDTTLVTVRNANHTIFLQKLHMSVTGPSAGKTWQVTDNSASPVELTGPFGADVDGAHFDRDFGPKGVPLTEGQSLRLDVSATGAAGIVTWEGYQQLTRTAAATAV